MNRREFLGNIGKSIMAIILGLIATKKNDVAPETVDFYQDYTYDPTTKIATIAFDWSEEPNYKDAFQLK